MQPVRSLAAWSARHARHRARAFGVEVLESRALLSNVSLVDDINSVDLYPQQLTPAGTNLFYTIANSDNTGTLLAVTTSGGFNTELTVAGLANPTSLTAVGDCVYFLVPGSAGNALWESDGTIAGTQEIAFADPNDASSTDVSDLTGVENRLFFLSGDPNSSSYGDDLWSLALGSTAPTLVGADITPGIAYAGAVTSLTAVGDVLYFTVTDNLIGNGTVQHQLWKSDGSKGELGPVAYVDPSTGQSADINNVFQIINDDGTLDYVSVNQSDGLPTLDSYDLTTVPQALATFVNQQLISNPAVVGANLFFDAAGASGGRQLWVTSGTSAGTMQLTSLGPGSEVGYPSNLTDSSGTLYFTATGANNQNQLWQSSGTIQGTSLVADLSTEPEQHVLSYYAGYTSGSSTASSPALAAQGRMLYFANGDATHGTELWSASSTEVPVLVDDIDPGVNSSAPHDFVDFSGAVYFVAHDGSSPQVSQLWAVSGGTPQAVASFAPAYTAGSETAFGPSATTTAVLGGTMIFVADDGVDGPAVWSSDGTTAGTVLLAPVAATRHVTFTGAAGDEEVYFVGDSPTGPTFWETDGTLAGTTLLSSLPLPPSGGPPYAPGQYHLTLAAGRLFFISSDGKGGQDLWSSDGTAAGTSIVKDFNREHTYYGSKRYYSLNINNLTAAAGTLFFTAYDPDGGEDLWSSDGTTKGTIVVKHFEHGSGYRYYNSPIVDLTPAGGELFFTADDGSAGLEPWASDGTPGGTVSLAVVDPGSTAAASFEFTQLGNAVYFFMNESSTTVGLWQTSGTAAGTIKVFDAFPSHVAAGHTYSPTLSNLTAIGSTLFFSLEYATNTPQFQLWTSDGTASGTSELTPSSLSSGSTFSELQQFFALGNLLVFTAADGEGADIWESDGTAGGTAVIADNGPAAGNYGYQGYYDAYQTLVNNGILYFAGATRSAGVELWQTDGTASGTQMVTDFSPGTYSSDPAPLAVVDDQLLFYANDGIHGEELWSDPLGLGPTITPIPAQAAVVEQQFSFDVQASEPGDPSANLAYSLIESAPQGASINASGAFGWTPTPAETPGVYDFTVRVTDTSDPGDPTSTASFLVTVEAAVASQVAIATPPLGISAGGMGQIALELEDQYGDQGAVSAAEQTITLSTSSAKGAFYSTESSTTPITSVVIPAGQSVTSVYYSDTRSGTPAVTASDAALAFTSTQQETVTPGPASQVGFTSAPLDIVTGSLGQIIVALEDRYANPTTSTSDQTITLRSTSPTGVFYASQPGTSPISSVAVLQGQSTVSFYYDDTKAGTPTITAADAALGSPATQQETLMPAPASQVVFTSVPLSLTAGAFGQVTLELEDASGNAVDAASPQTVSLSTTSAGGAFVATPLSTSSLTSVTIALGQSTISFYYFDTTAGTPVVTADDASLSSAPSTQQQTVAPAAASQIAFASAALSLVAGTRAQVTIQLQDQFGNPVGSSSPQTINLGSTSATGSFLATETSTTPVTILNFAAGQDAVSFYYSDTTAGTPTLMAADGSYGASPPSQQETVTAAAASRVAITTAALTLAAGTRGQLTIDLEDSFGNPARASSLQTIDLSTTSAAGRFFATPTSTIAINSYVISAGQASVSGYYDDATAGTPMVTAADTALGSAPAQMETVTPGPAFQVAITSAPLTLVAGIIGPVTIELEDQFGNLGATSATIQTISLATTSAAGTFFSSPTGGTPIERIEIGAGQTGATFSYADIMAGAPTLTLSDAALGSAASQQATIAADPATQLVVTTGPPTSISAGLTFSLVVSADDVFKNLDPNYSGAVTLNLAGDPNFTTTMRAEDGVATFTGLTVTTSSSGELIQISAAGLTGTATNPLSVSSVAPPPPPPASSPPPLPLPPPPPATASAPTVVLQRLATIQKSSKKGKPVGKPVFSGFYIQYSQPMNAATAGLAADYQVLSSVIKKVKKQTTRSDKPVPFSVSYSPAQNAVTINLKTTRPFAQGGEITIRGVISQAGIALSSSDTTFTILARAKGIKIG
jgi:ELWxxDGT repeat protein